MEGEVNRKRFRTAIPRIGGDSIGKEYENPEEITPPSSPQIFPAQGISWFDHRFLELYGTASERDGYLFGLCPDSLPPKNSIRSLPHAPTSPGGHDFRT